MDVAQRLLRILGVYQDNSELISAAVSGLRRVEDSGLTSLRQGYEERKRKFILKAIALLAPSDVPAKVVEVDGVDDAELLICQDKGWLKSALAIYLRTEDVANAVSALCHAELGDAVGAYAQSTLAAIWDHVELGDEGLTELVKPKIYECADLGRQVLENAREFCQTEYDSLPELVLSKIIAFQASRDDHRRFALVTVVAVESGTGKVVLYDRNSVKTSGSYTVDSSAYSGIEFISKRTDDSDAQDRNWMTLAVLCSMFVEVYKIPDRKGLQLVNSIVRRLDSALQTCVNELDSLRNLEAPVWVPSRNDLKQIHNRNVETTRMRLRRSFKAKNSLIESIKTSSNLHNSKNEGDRTSLALQCLADREIFHLGGRLVKAYEEQQTLSTKVCESGSSSVFATFIYSSLGLSVVAEEYRQIFSSRKVNIRSARSGTLIFVPHSELVTMTTHGMVCNPVKVENSQIFAYDSADRFVLLPHLIEILGLRQDDVLLSTLVREMDDNAYLIADPMTMNVRACITRSLEESRKEFRVSALHEAALHTAGKDHFQGLIREAVSLLARLGATVPREYIGRASFLDVTRELKNYRDFSSQIKILFDRGVILEHVGCEVSLEGDLVHVLSEHEGAFVIAHITPKNLKRAPQTAQDDGLSEMEAAMKASGLVLMRPVFEVIGDVRLAVTRSEPGRGILSLFGPCEAR